MQTSYLHNFEVKNIFSDLMNVNEQIHKAAFVIFSFRTL